MFEDVEAAQVLAVVRAHDAGGDGVENVMGATHVDAIRALDRSIAAAQAEQLRQINLLTQAQGGSSPSSEAMLSVVGEVSMVRNIGATAAGSQVALAYAMGNLPQVFALLRDGIVSESVARAVTKHTAGLDPADVEVADGEIARRLPGLTLKRAARMADRVVIGLDADAATERAERARADCFVSMEPGPDGIAHLCARGPAEQITAVFNAVDAHATGLRGTGDDRTRGQIQLATLVERVTGLTHADQVDVEVQVIVDAKTLVGADADAAELVGCGPIAPDVADDLIARAHRATIRRLFVDPVTGHLVGVDQRRRRYDGHDRRTLAIRDSHRCRRPGCDCRARDADHIHDYAIGGPTTTANGQLVCKRSHTIKHLPGWHVRPRTDGAITWRTPSGHEYTSLPPPLLQ